MLYKKPNRVTSLHTGAYGKPVDFQSASRDEHATGIKPANQAPCPACGASGCHQHASVKGHARYRCQNCFRVFSVLPIKPQVQSDAYERWLADMAS